MRLRHIFALGAACSLTAVLFAADVRLGPETPVSPATARDVVPAAYAQKYPAIASNGSGYLALWVDGRGDSSGSSLYAGRLDPDGRPMEPFGHRIGATYNPPVIVPDPAGPGYVVGWFNGNTLYLQRLDENGYLIESIAPSEGIPYGSCAKADPKLLSIGTNGSTWVVRESRYCYAPVEVVRFIDSSHRQTKVHEEWRYTTGASIQTAGSSYVVIDLGVDIRVRTFDGVGNLVSDWTIAIQLSPNAIQLKAAMAGDRILVAGSVWENKPTKFISYRVVDRWGSVILPETTIPVPEGTGVTDVLEDGREFLLGLKNSSTRTFSALRVSKDGKLLTPDPIVLSTTAMPDRLALASSGTSVLLWADHRFSRGGDIVSRVVPGFADPALVSVSARAQGNVQIASAGAHRMTVWSDSQEIGGRLDEVELRIAGSAHSLVGAPFVAAGGDCFLVAWKEQTAAGTSRLLARRYALDGTSLDAEPLVLGSDLTSFHDSFGVAFDGSSFLVAAAASRNEVLLVPVDPAGGTFHTMVHPLKLDLTGQSESLRVLRPVAAGSRWLVPYLTERQFGVLDVAPSLGSVNHLSLPFPPSFDLSVATGSGRISYASVRSFGGSRFFQTTPDGQAVAGETSFAYSPSRAALAWNGTEYVLVWTEDRGTAIDGAHRVKAVRLAGDGRLLDATPFEIASGRNVAPFTAPSIAVTENGVVIAYCKADDANTGVVRAYVRTLDRLAPPVSRRPAVRH